MLFHAPANVARAANKRSIERESDKWTSVRRPPHLTLHAVGGFKLAKVLAILITVFYTDKQMAKVRRKTACLS